MAVQECSWRIEHLTEPISRQLLFAADQARFLVVLTDVEGVVTFVNRAFETLTGYTREEAVGNNVTLLRSGYHDAAFYDGIRQSLAAGQTWTDRLMIGKKDGTYFRSRTTAAPVTDSDGALLGYCFFSRDTTDESKLEAQIGHMQKMEAIGELAAGIAHEINTPIQYVGDNIQFMKEALAGVFRLVDALELACEAGRDGAIAPERISEIAALREEIDLAYLREELPLAIAQAMEGRDRVAAIVRAMKEFAHPGDEELTPVDVNHAIQNTLAVSRGEWKHVADVETDLDAALPPVPCYPGSFNQVLLNLVVNAAHAIAEVQAKSPGAHGLIRFATRYIGREVSVAIRDSGAGIPPAIIHRIFEPFYTTKDVGKGTGQGLALAHAVIVDRMHGRIEVDSTPGKGTEFTLYLPLEIESDEVAGAK